MGAQGLREGTSKGGYHGRYFGIQNARTLGSFHMGSVIWTFKGSEMRAAKWRLAVHMGLVIWILRLK